MNLFHSIQVAFEGIYVPGPKLAELVQPDIQFLKWFRLQPVQAALRIHGGLHETGLSQHTQVLGHGGLRHTKLPLYLSYRLLGRNQEAQYRSAVRLGNDFER